MIAQPVAEGVFRVSLAWSNAYILTDGQGSAALIDTGLQKDRPRLLAALREVGLTETQVRAVYLTHAHTDHGGNAAYFARQGAHLGLHRDEAPYIGLPRRTYVPRGWKLVTQCFSALLFAGGEWLYPVERHDADLRLADGECLEAPGGALQVIATPGHSPGHASYWREKDGLLFSGDAILNLIPITRKTALSMPLHVFSADWEMAKRSARSLAKFPTRQMLAGHGYPLREDAAERIAAWTAKLR